MRYCMSFYYHNFWRSIIFCQKMEVSFCKNGHFLMKPVFSLKLMLVERQTIPCLNALVNGTKILEEQLYSSFRGCHATSPLKCVFFTRKVAWQPLKELQNCSSSILVPPTRAFKWGIVCLSTIITFEYTSSYVKNCWFYIVKMDIFWHNYLYLQKLW